MGGEGLAPEAFLGRSSDLECLHRVLQESDRPGLVVLWGMPGVGKSELAVQYAQRYPDCYPGGVVRFNGAQFGEELVQWIQANYLDPAEDLRRQGTKAEQQLVKGWQAWAASPYVRTGGKDGDRPVLILIDQVSSLKEEVLPFLPKGELLTAEMFPFHFLLTSRIRWDLPPGSRWNLSDLELRELAPEVAVQFFADAIATETDLALAETLAAKLGYLPLALQLVRQWLAIDPDRSLKMAVEALQQQSLQSSVLQPNPEVQSLWDAIALSWADLPRWDRSAQPLLQVLALLAEADLPWDFVLEVVNTYRPPEPPPPPRIPGGRHCLAHYLGKTIPALQPPPPPEAPIYPGIANATESRGNLVRTSWLQTLPGNSYRLHALLREFVQQHQPPAEPPTWDKTGWITAWGKAALERSLQIPAQSDWDTLQQWQPLIPLLQGAAHHLKPLDAQSASRIQTRCGRLSLLPIFAETLERGEKARDQARALGQQGNLPAANAKFAEALELYENAITQVRAVLPTDSPMLAGYLHRIAGCLNDIGQYRKALPPAEEACTIAETRSPRLTLANFLNTLGVVYYYQGQYEAAEPVLKRSLSIHEQQLGADHPDTAPRLNNLAGLYESQGRY
ncbi:MAG: tetratricopeptide repeat protein, partial [Prochlorotrichaceae cyanobacterium]